MTIKPENAETKFKRIVNEIIDEGVYPGPTVINLRVRGRHNNNLNGRETRWRRSVMHDRGIKLQRPFSGFDYDYELIWY